MINCNALIMNYEYYVVSSLLVFYTLHTHINTKYSGTNDFLRHDFSS